MNPAIHTQSLSKHFGKTLAVDSISLTVPEGSIYALVGANGAGKTTLIKLLMNILRASAGSAQVLGIDAEKLTGTAFNRIGYVSENQELPEGMTVGGMLDYFRGFYPNWDRAAAFFRGDGRTQRPIPRRDHHPEHPGAAAGGSPGHMARTADC